MTAFTTERWAEKMLFALKEAKGGFAGRVVNHNFHNPGGDKADAVKVINPTLTVVGVAIDKNDNMPTYNDAASDTITINLDTPLKYAVGLPWSVQLKTEHDVERGYKMTCEDMILQQRNAIVQKAIEEDANIPIVAGTAAAPVQVTKDNVLSFLTKFRVQLMKTGAIMENGTYRFVDLEEQENQSELTGEQQDFDMGQEVPGALSTQVKTALPILGVPSAVYEMIIEAATEAGILTENKEFYGHVPVIRGFEIVLDEALDHTGDDTNQYLGVIAATRNLVTEGYTQSRAEKLPDKDKYRDILRGMIIYGAKVTNPKCGAKAFFKLTA